MRGGVVMLKVDSWPSFAWSFLIVKLFHFLQYRILVESASDCMTRWTRHLNDWPTWIKENCVQHLFRTWLSWQYMVVFDLFAFIAYYQPFFVAQTCAPKFHHLLASSRTHLRRCVFCSSVSKWGTHLAQTFLMSKRFFRSVCTLPSDMPVLFVLRFYGPVIPMGSCRARSAYLTTPLLGRFSPLSG